MKDIYTNYSIGLGAPTWIHVYGPILFLLVVWSIFWKGLSLWHSGKKAQGKWFVVLLILNTAGILDIIYLFFVLKLRFSQLFSK